MIDRTVVLLDPEKLGLNVVAYALVSLNTHTEAVVEEFKDRLLRVPEVTECAKVTGTADYLIKFRTESLQSYDRIMTEKLLRAPEVAHVQSSIVLQVMKSTTQLPLPGGGDFGLDTR